MNKKNKKFGFTLAEAMIVMVILGVIGAICIQGLKIYNAQQKGFDTKAQKALSIIGQAVIMILLEDSSSDDLLSLHDEVGKFSIAQADKIDRVAKTFRKHLTVNELSVDTTVEYFSNDLLNYKKEPIAKLNDMYSNFFYLNDGMLFGFRLYGNCTSAETNAAGPNSRVLETINNICASIFVDVNGIKKPNKLGSDQYIIPLDSRGIKFNND